MATSASVPTRAVVLSTIGNDDCLHAEPLFVLASLLGHSDKAMRDCLTRLTNQGILTHLGGRGRKASYRATDAGRALMEVDLGWTAFAHRVDAGLEPWECCWHLVGFAVPERQRSARDALRGLFVEFGAAPIQSGLYVHPYDFTSYVFQLADHLGVPDAVVAFTTKELRHHTRMSNEELAERIWPLAELANRYSDLERKLNILERDAPHIEGDRLAASILAVTIEMESVLRDDPLLPLEVLPERWAGTQARRAFMTAHSVVTAHSDLFSDSRLMLSFATEIERSLAESSEEFWDRWSPRLMDAYRVKLPPAANRLAQRASTSR